MKKCIVFFLLLCLPLYAKKPSPSSAINAKENNAQRVLVDKLEVVIYAGDDHILLTESELKLPSINGTKQKKKDVIDAREMEYEANHVYKMPIPEDSISKYLASLKEQGLDQDRLKEMFKNAGYSYEEGIEELRRMITIDSLLNFKIKSRLVVPEEEVKAYYTSFPQVIPASYKIKRGFIGENLLSESELEELQKTGKHSQLVEWMSPYWQSEDEFSETYTFIFSMKEGQIAKPRRTDEGYEIIKLLEKKPSRKKSFEESYKEIAEKLRMPLFEKLLAEYKKELSKKYEVVYL